MEFFDELERLGPLLGLQGRFNFIRDLLIDMRGRLAFENISTRCKEQNWCSVLGRGLSRASQKTAC